MEQVFSLNIIDAEISRKSQPVNRIFLEPISTTVTGCMIGLKKECSAWIASAAVLGHH